MGAREPERVKCQFCPAEFVTSDEDGLAGDQHADHLTDEHQEIIERLLSPKVVV